MTVRQSGSHSDWLKGDVLSDIGSCGNALGVTVAFPDETKLPSLTEVLHVRNKKGHPILASRILRPPWTHRSDLDI